MITVFLSHSSKDKPFVRQLADHLEHGGEIKAWLDEREIAPGANIVEEISDGLGCNFILLILSPDSVDSAWVKEEWTDAFWEQTNERRTKLAGVLFRDCTIPRLLRNKKYFDLRTNQPEGFRAIRTWLLTEKPVPPPHINPLPTRPPLFVGREAELSDLRERLQPGRVVSLSGMPGRGKTTLALEFAHRYQTDFESVYWVPCQSQSLPTMASDLARQLGLNFDKGIDQIASELRFECARKRCLLVLDNVDDESPGALIPGGAASVLVTTRQPGLRFLRLHPGLPLELFSEEQCFELFRQVLGTEEVAAQERDCRTIFTRTGRLPLAISLLAGLIQHDVRYTIASVAARVPGDVTKLIEEAIRALADGARTLLAAMGACAAEGFRLSLAASLVPLDETAALEALYELSSRSLVEEIDRKLRRYRLHALVREASQGERFRKRHAEVVKESFKNWEADWRQCERDLPDFQAAFTWALADTEELGRSITESLAFCGFQLIRRLGYLAESFEICRRMERSAEQRENKQSLQGCYGNQALILKAWGRLEEALALHQKQEALCLELGNKDGLSRTYGNQGLILQDWGRLEEALALHQKEEALCLELGNRDGLQACYGNQGLILKAWGRLEEALALHQKEEALCLELGNRDGLQACYGNQGLILKAWGRLEEALALHQKQEALCLELGNRDGLQACYGNQALILKAWGRLEEALALHQKEEALCLELGNRDGLQACYGNQALILKAWGRLEEALALHQKQEALCLELGNKRSLGYCYSGWGLLARAQEDYETELEKLNAALTLFTDLGMPRERDAVAAELAKSRGASAS